MAIDVKPDRQQTQPASGAPGPRRYSPEEAKQIVDEVWRIGVEDAFKRIWEHPLTSELAAGTLPIEVIRGFISNFCVLAQEVNASSGAGFYGQRAFYSRFPEHEAIRADGIADEFTAPGPGGHQRTIETVARALGVTRADLADFHVIPEMRTFLDAVVMDLREGSAGAGGVNISEEWLSEWFKVWTKSLKQHYGFSDDDVYYFVMHSEADGKGEHYGGPTVDAEVMGHADRQRSLAQQALEAGLGPPNPLETWKRIAIASTDAQLLMMDGCYERYYPADKVKQPCY